MVTHSWLQSKLSLVLLDARAVFVAVVLETESHCISLALNSFHRGPHSPCFVVHHVHLSCVCFLIKRYFLFTCEIYQFAYKVYICFFLALVAQASLPFLT